MNKILIVILLLVFSCKNNSWAQEKKLSLLSFQSADSLDKKRVRGMTVLGVGCYAGMFTLLSQAWYSKYDRTKFHLFNDNQEWAQIQGNISKCDSTKQAITPNKYHRTATT